MNALSLTLYWEEIFISGTPQCLRDAAYPAVIRLSTSMTPSSPPSNMGMSVGQLRLKYAGFCQVPSEYFHKIRILSILR